MVSTKKMTLDVLAAQGNLAAPVEEALAEKWATEIRRILNLDLPEIDIATEVQLVCAELAQEHDVFQAAWMLLEASERAAWKAYAKYDEWLKTKQVTRAD